MIDVQDAAALGFIGLCNRTCYNRQDDGCNKLRYHENPHQLLACAFRCRPLIRLTVTLTGAFFSINKKAADATACHWCCFGPFAMVKRSKAARKTKKTLL